MRYLRVGSWVIMAITVTHFFFYPADLGQAQAAKASSEASAIQPVNLNQASAEELQTVRGIGPALAERIVNYREANGKFKSLEQLMEIQGIGSAKLGKIKNQITL